MEELSRSFQIALICRKGQCTAILKPSNKSLRLSLIAYNLILEEFPLSEKYIKKVNDNYNLLTTEVGNFLDVGRFVLGLPGKIEVDYPQALKDYLKSDKEN